MKKWIALAVVLLAGYFVAWPAWSGWRIAQALQGRDATLLEQKVDFPAVRTSLTPAVTSEVDKGLERALKEGGLAGQLLGPDVKREIGPRIVKIALDTVVTPENIIRVVAEGGDWKQAFEKVLREQLAKSGGVPGLPAPAGGGGGQPPGGLGGLFKELGKELGVPGLPGQRPGEPKAAAPAPASTPAKPTAFGPANVKRFAYTGLTSLEVGVARDPAASEPDLTAEFRFTGTDWKLVGLRPRL